MRHSALARHFFVVTPSVASTLLASSAPPTAAAAAVALLRAFRMTTAKSPNAVVIAGPSGVGKGTLIERLRAEYPDKFGFSVSHTTRAPRPGEVDGIHYNFTTVPDIQAAIAAGAFIENAEVHGKYYGTSVAAVEAVRAEGKICILDIDVQGCRLVRQKKLPATFVFVAPPSEAELERRLRGRGTEDEAAVVKRMTTAKVELEAMDEAGLFDKIIVNDNLDAAYRQLKTVLADDLAVARAKPM
jgi:guanylate kinase